MSVQMDNLESADETSVAISPEDLAIEVKNVNVSFRSYNERPATLKDGLIKFVKTGRLRYYSTFEALSDVSFSVKKGSVFGILGSNGAGKSTMLRVLAGVLKPSSGVVNMQGTVDSLISLGAGFDPDLNAIENIYLNGSLHQQSKEEIAERVPRIIEFAELEEFATTPIRYYSSGMNARLGFGTAIDRKPDILLVDEVLAVGDERFQQKCDAVFEEHLAANRTIVIVSHNLGLIESMCSEVALLSKGRVVYSGEPTEALRLYRDKSYETRLHS